MQCFREQHGMSGSKGGKEGERGRGAKNGATGEIPRNVPAGAFPP